MKRIFLVVMILLLVLPVIPVSAAKDMDHIIYDEVIRLVDVQQYLADSTDTGIYLMSVVENGYTKDGFTDQSGLYLYLYNPSRKKVTDSDLNMIQIATRFDEDGKPTSFRKYSITIDGDSMNGLYIRAHVNANAKALVVMDGNTRRYGISGIELTEDNAYEVKEYAVAYTFSFTGYGKSISCEVSSFLTISLEVGQTSYITGDSSRGDGYSNQVSSVYFSVPKEIEEKYGALYSLEYEYYKYRSAPMLVTTDSVFYEKMKRLVGKKADPKNWSVKIKALIDGTSLYRGIYGAVKDKPLFETCTDALYDEWNIVFKADSLEEGDIMVTGADIAGYFQGYVHPSGQTVRGYSKALFDMDEYADDHYQKVTVTRDEVFDMPSYADTHNWWDGFLDYGLWYDKDDHDNTLEDVQYIQSLALVNFLSPTFCDDYLVSSCDVDALKEYCTSAKLAGNNIYLLRFAYSDNYAVNRVSAAADFGLYYFYHKADDEWQSAEAVIVEEDVYLDFDIITLSFSDDGKKVTTFAAVMSPVDVFPGLEGVQTGQDPPPPPCDWLRKLVAIVLVIIGVVLILEVVKRLGQVGQARASREATRYFRNQNKKK